MFGKRKYEEPTYEEDFEEPVEEIDAPVQAEQAAPELTQEPAYEEAPKAEVNLWDSIITKIDSTYNDLKETILESENLLDDTEKKVTLGDYALINQKVLSYVGYIKGLLEILNESNYISDNFDEMTADQKVIARFTSEFLKDTKGHKCLVSLLQENNVIVQEAFRAESTPAPKTATVANESRPTVLERLNQKGYQGMHRDIASSIGYMDALLEILTDSVNPEEQFSREFTL